MHLWCNMYAILVSCRVIYLVYIQLPRKIPGMCALKILVCFYDFLWEIYKHKKKHSNLICPTYYSFNYWRYLRCITYTLGVLKFYIHVLFWDCLLYALRFTYDGKVYVNVRTQKTTNIVNLWGFALLYLSKKLYVHPWTKHTATKLRCCILVISLITCVSTMLSTRDLG